jgi:hypothetical protein
MTVMTRPGSRSILMGLSLSLAVMTVVAAVLPSLAQSRDRNRADEATAATSRPRILIQPRRQRLSANAKRVCTSTLVQQFRASGTVIYPSMTCWWQ